MASTFLQAEERMSYQEIAELQLNKLKKQVERCYNVPFYREKFDQMGLKPFHI